MAARRVASRTAASGIGATMRCPCSTRRQRAPSCWSAPAWAPGSCCLQRLPARSVCADWSASRPPPISLTTSWRLGLPRRTAPDSIATACCSPRPLMVSHFRSPAACSRTARATFSCSGPFRCAARSISCTASWTPTCRGRPRFGSRPLWAAESAAVTVDVIKDGDHRLSRDKDLRRIATALDRVLQQVRGDG